MLMHHSTLPYEETAQKAIENFKEKMTAIIEKGKTKAQKTIEEIMNEYQIRQDMLIPSHAIQYELAEDTNSDTMGLSILIGSKNKIIPTQHSLQQLLERLGLPKSYAQRLSKKNREWSRKLLMENLDTLTRNVINGDKLLFRIVGDTAKGILSSAYRRMDASPIFETFIREGINQGLVPVDGANTDTRYHLKMMHREIYQPAPDEAVCFGLSITTSDYGASALTLSLFLVRLWCTNFAISENLLRQIHLGKRFNDDNEMLSQETYDLDTKTVASAVRDIVRNGIEGKIEETCKLIADANQKKVNVKEEIEKLQKRGTITKEMAITAETLYNNVNEITLLPENKSAWRFSNVLSLMAQSYKNDKKIDLEEAAMDVIRR